MFVYMEAAVMVPSIIMNIVRHQVLKHFCSIKPIIICQKYKDKEMYLLVVVVVLGRMLMKVPSSQQEKCSLSSSLCITDQTENKDDMKPLNSWCEKMDTERNT